MMWYLSCKPSHLNQITVCPPFAKSNAKPKGYLTKSAASLEVGERSLILTLESSKRLITNV